MSLNVNMNENTIQNPFNVDFRHGRGRDIRQLQEKWKKNDAGISEVIDDFSFNSIFRRFNKSEV